MIEIYHIDPTASSDLSLILTATDAAPARRAFDAGLYTKVATVATDSLNYAWRWTNSVTTSWSLEPAEGVSIIAPLPVFNGETYGHRSSMVGDIFVKDGKPYVVASVGFIEV